MSPLHRAALTYVRAGFKIFPCLPNSKVPACDHGFHDATDNEDQINNWWTQWPGANIASPLSACGWSVVDLDSKEAEDKWAELAKDDPDTWTVRTPRGGLHIYLHGNLPVSVGRLLPGFKADTRGPGSYVLLPPSHTDASQPGCSTGDYTVEIEADVAPVPEWLAPYLAAMRKGGAVASSDVEPDLPVNLRRAERWLRDREPAIEGAGGNEWTYRTAAALADMGLSEEAVLALMAGEWNDRCQPSWQDDELEGVVTNATRYRQNEGGQHAARDLATVYAGALGPTLVGADVLVADVVTLEKRSRFRPRSEAEQDEGVEPTWLIPGLIPDNEAVMLYGPTQSYKSFIALDLALSVAAGVPLFAGAPTRAGPVFYAALEGRRNIEKLRRPAWKKEHGITEPIPFYSLPAPMRISPEDCEEWEAEIRAFLKPGERPGLIVLDTVAKVLSGKNENDAKDMGDLIAWTDGLVDRFQCPVLAVHHTGRDATHSRGSSAADAGFGSIIVATAHRETKMVRIHVQKHKDAEEPEPWYLEGKVAHGSLVFSPVSKSEYEAATRVESAYSAIKVQRMLIEIGARGDALKGVSTQILATHFVDDATDDKKRARIEKTLTRMARDSLSAYVTDAAGILMWHVPE